MNQLWFKKGVMSMMVRQSVKKAEREKAIREEIAMFMAAGGKINKAAPKTTGVKKAPKITEADVANLPKELLAMLKS